MCVSECVSVSAVLWLVKRGCAVCLLGGVIGLIRGWG
jgi:hypothetical protein